jgi:hypothetical protein
MGLTLFLPAESPDTEDDAEQCDNNDHPDDGKDHPGLEPGVLRHHLDLSLHLKENRLRFNPNGKRFF